MRLTKIFKEFFENEKTSGFLLIACTIISLILTNSSLQEDYTGFWHFNIFEESLQHWINDGLMSLFFLLIGLELKREIIKGELSNIKKALLPILGALGGMIVPVIIYLVFNKGTSVQSGAGIPMATDIAFAVGILSLLGNKIPNSLKVFLTVLAVIDDLGAIIIIATVYTSTIIWTNLIIALGVFAVLLFLNKSKIYNLIPYLFGGIIMWYFMLHSGIHPTITGVMLAFAIPLKSGVENNNFYRLQHFLHKPVLFLIIPLFVLSNTAIPLDFDWQETFSESYSKGIFFGLAVGKPLGIILFSWIGVMINISQLPKEITWSSLMGAGILGGIGFTMSIFITTLAFEDEMIMNYSKLTIITASFMMGIVGFLWLKFNSSHPKKIITAQYDLETV